MKDLIDNEVFPFKERVAERNLALGKATDAYNKSVTPALLAYHVDVAVIEKDIKEKMAVLETEKNKLIKQRATEYQETIIPHRRAYEQMTAAVIKANPIFYSELGQEPPPDA